jgi:hypothetical protein
MLLDICVSFLKTGVGKEGRAFYLGANLKCVCVCAVNTIRCSEHAERLWQLCVRRHGVDQ